MIRVVPAVLSLVLGVEAAIGQQMFDDVRITGQVRKVTLCGHDDEAWYYRFMIKVQARNQGAQPAIISTASGLVVYYKTAPTLDQVKTRHYNHILWMTSGFRDPSVPSQIVAPFEIVRPNKTVTIDIDFFAIVSEELKPGPAYIQVIAENWPSYSDEYVVKLKRAWARHGLLWEHSLHTEPILFTVPAGLKKGYCP